MMENELLKNLEQIINENSELKTVLAEMEISKRNWALRERLYQSELTTLKNMLIKIADNIKTTPHSTDPEYIKQAYGEKPNIEG